MSRLILHRGAAVLRATETRSASQVSSTQTSANDTDCLVSNAWIFNEALGLPADKVVFVDDQPRNVAGGSAVGIHSFHLDITNPLEGIARVKLAMGL